MSDAELLKEIALLAGAINRKKNEMASQNAPNQPYAVQTAPTYVQGGYRGRGGRGGRGGYNSHYATRGGRGRDRGNAINNLYHPNNSRTLNNTLERVNNVPSASTPVATSTTTTIPSTKTDDTFIYKNDGNMTLINSNIYASSTEREAKLRGIAQMKRKLEETLKQTHSVINAAKTGTLVTVHGQQFKIIKEGRKLIRLSRDPATISKTPKKITIDGIVYIRSKNGNLIQFGSGKLPLRKYNQHCPYFTKNGTCRNGNKCPYTHDPKHVAICKFFLRGKCTRGDSCLLSHTSTANNSPLCLHFLRGNCNNEKCLYTHVKVNPNAKVCKDFAMLGWCDKGDKCTLRHVWECPEFSEKGSCAQEKCQLQHVIRSNDDKAAIQTKHNNNINATDKDKHRAISVEQLAMGLYDEDEEELEEEEEEKELQKEKDNMRDTKMKDNGRKPEEAYRRKLMQVEGQDDADSEDSEYDSDALEGDDDVTGLENGDDFIHF